jgi:multisubunit Na+/H+ antiporter MnhB subunit
MKTSRNRKRLLSWCLATGLTVLCGALAWAVLSLPPERAGLQEAAHAGAAAQGLDNPVTAVLLDMRGYDTLLEVAVLLLAAVGVRVFASVGPLPPRLPDDPPDALLAQFVHILAPLMTLTAGYLLWAGADHPGGAFQAGAVIAAAGVLLVVSGARLPKIADWCERLLLAFGLFVFAAVSAGLLMQGALLQYPLGRAKGLMLLVESAATLSIAAILLMLFLAKPIGAQARLRTRGKDKS